MLDLIPNPLIVPVGLFIGVLFAAPIGPVNVLILQRALERGFWGGVAAGVGGVLGDGLIAMLAALGVGSVTGAFGHYRAAIQILGGLALIGYGAKIYLYPPEPELIDAAAAKKTSLGDFAWDIPKIFLLTITNPPGVIGLFAIFGAVSTFAAVTTYVEAFIMVAAIIAGSMATWVLLSHLIARLRDQLSPRHLQRLNAYAGLLLLLFGAVLVAEVVWKGGRLT